METKELLEKKRALNAEVDKIKEQIREKGGSFFAEVLKPLFDAEPRAKAFRFTAYTPYFNDGDSCTFSSHHDYGWVLFEDADGELLDSNEETIPGLDYEQISAIEKPFRDALGVFTDDDIETFFGDHVEITIYPDRVEVEEHSHD